MSDLTERVPVTIVTGFLGSGKTTLVNRALRVGGLGRVAALVNDFGALDIDAALVAEVADEVVTLQNGCVCCTINGDLYRAVERVLALDPPIDRIVVETTGVADPLPVGLTFIETDLARQTVLEAVVTVVDCANFALDLFKSSAAMAQIVHGDIVVLNKCDLVDADKIASLTRRIAAIKPRAHVLEASFGQIPLAAMLAVKGEPSLGGTARPDCHDDAGHQHHHHHLLDDGFVAHAVRIDGPLSSSKFQQWLDRGLPRSIFRAKGLIGFGGSTARYLFQFCGGRAGFEIYDGPVEDNRLVFIGREIDVAELNAMIRDCMSSSRSIAA